MITDIRAMLKTRGVRVLIWVMLSSLFVGTISMIIRFSGRTAEDSIALVNGYDISISEFRRKYLETQNMIREIKQMYGPQADMVLKMYGYDRKADQLVLDALVGEKVLKSATDALGTAVHSDHVHAKLRDPYFVRQYLGGVIPPQAIRGGTLDVAALQYTLKRQGISEADFDEMLNDTLLRAFLFTLIEGGLYIPEEALKSAYIGQFLKKKYSYFTVPRSKYVTKAQEKKLTQPEIEAYYSKPVNRENYRIPEKRSAKIWTFNADGFGTILSEEDLKKEYNRQRRTFIKTPAQVQVQHILFTFTDDTKLKVRGEVQEVLKKALANPGGFADLAAKHSESPDKGKTITLKRSDKNKNFTDAAFNLKKDALSAVTETPDGFEIIKLIEKKQPVFKTFDEVKDELSKKVKQEKFGRTFMTNAQRVISQSREEPAFLTKFIERHKGKESSVNDVTRSEKLQSSKVFGIRRVGNKAFYQEGDNGYIVELTKIVPSVVPELKTIQQKVEKDIYSKRAQELLKKDIDSSLTQIRSGKKNLTQVAKDLGGTVDITDWVTFEDQASLKKLKDLKISLPELRQLTKQGAVEGGLTDTAGYLIQVKQMDPFKREEFAQKKALMRYRQGREELQGLSASFVQVLQDKAKITTNTNLMRQVAR